MNTLWDENSFYPHYKGKLFRLKEDYILYSNNHKYSHDKLKYLYEILKGTPAQNQYEIKREIENLESIIHELNISLEGLEKEIDEEMYRGDLIYYSLLKLNYVMHEQLFTQLIRKSKVGAFVIYGESGYGQRWICRRLTRRLTSSSSMFRWVNLQPHSQAWNINILQDQLGFSQDQMKTHKITSFSELAEKIHLQWQTQNVIIFFYHFSAIEEGLKKNFIDGFWHELIQKSMSKFSMSPHTWLLLLFVEENEFNNRIDSWPVTFTEQIDTNWKPEMFVKAPRLAQFDRVELADWIKKVSHMLPREIRLEDILDDQPSGIPDDVFLSIYDFFDPWRRNVNE